MPDNLKEEQNMNRIISEIIKKQILIQGREHVLEAIRKVSGLEVDEEGNALSYQGSPKHVILHLTEEFSALNPLAKVTIRVQLINFRMQDPGLQVLAELLR